MCLVEYSYSPALNGPGTKCDASFLPLDPGPEMRLDFWIHLFFFFFCLLGFEYQAKAVLAAVAMTILPPLLRGR